MKKYFTIIFISFVSFFLFGFKVSALDFDLNFDENTHFNFFYEMKENTPFYRWLLSNSSDFKSSLNELHNKSIIGYATHYMVSISYYDDISSIVGSGYTDPKYVVQFITSYSGCSGSYSPHISYNDTNGDLSTSYNYNSIGTCPTPQVYSYYYIFNSQAEYIGFYQSNPESTTGNNFTTGLSHDYFSVDNMAYTLSSVFYTTDSISYYSSTKPDLRLNKLIIDSQTYYIKNYTTYNLFSNFLRGIGALFSGIDYLDSSDFGLDYYRINYMMTDTVNFPSLFKTLNYSNSTIQVPTGYSNTPFDLTNNVSLFPKTSCSVTDSALYVYSNVSDSFDLYLHDINATDELGYQAVYYSIYNSIKGNIIRINPLSKVKNTSGDITTFPQSEFINHYYRFSRTTNLNSYVLYYNPDCYAVSYGDTPVSWVNPLSSNTITYDNSYTDWVDPDNVGAGNSIPFLSDSGDYDLSDITGDALSSASSFVKSMTHIVSFGLTLFNAFPNEVQYLLISFLGIGLVIILVKIIL